MVKLWEWKEKMLEICLKNFNVTTNFSSPEFLAEKEVQVKKMRCLIWSNKGVRNTWPPSSGNTTYTKNPIQYNKVKVLNSRKLGTKHPKNYPIF